MVHGSGVMGTLLVEVIYLGKAAYQQPQDILLNTIKLDEGIVECFHLQMTCILLGPN